MADPDIEAKARAVCRCMDCYPQCLALAPSDACKFCGIVVDWCELRQCQARAPISCATRERIAQVLQEEREQCWRRCWELVQERALQLEGAALSNDETPYEHGGPADHVSQEYRAAARKLRSIMDEIEPRTQGSSKP